MTETLRLLEPILVFHHALTLISTSVSQIIDDSNFRRISFPSLRSFFFLIKLYYRKVEPSLSQRRNDKFRVQLLSNSLI